MTSFVKPLAAAGSFVLTAVPALAQSTTRTIAPDPAVAQYSVPASSEPTLSHDKIAGLLRKKIKYIFVLYQENRSFDSYFGTFPGADGLFSQAPSQTPGFVQTMADTDGQPLNISPFRIGPDQFAADLDDVDHSHSMIGKKMDVVNGVALMDHYASSEEQKYWKSGMPSERAKQYGELTMAYEDGDTIPFLWRYANRFVLCDHIFQLMAGPSTPGNLSIIGAQTGQTQWMLHPDEAYTGNGDRGRGLPVTNDAVPFWGSAEDKTVKGRQPYNSNDIGKAGDPNNVQYNLTYATVPLTLQGKSAKKVTDSDNDPANDLADIHDDIGTLTNSKTKMYGWGWYQEGYGTTPTAGANDPLDAEGRHVSYVTHHNGPQYFGYIANNPKMSESMRDINTFLADVSGGKLASDGGLYFVKGGSKNFMGLKPLDPEPYVQINFLGDDDHPLYSDSHISEAMLATVVNTIARSKYWDQCAIIITWDDSEGDYDHLPPPIRSTGPDKSVITDGARVPMLVISPYAKVHGIDSDMGDHASVIKFTDTVLGLIPLADLPDELKGRKIGESVGLKNEGPFDDLTDNITDLIGAFDPARLSGKAPMLPNSYVIIDDGLIKSIPRQAALGLEWVGVTPTDYAQGIANNIPADFAPRPNSSR